MLILQRIWGWEDGHLKKKLGGAGEMAALSEDPGLIPSTQMAVHKCL